MSYHPLRIASTATLCVFLAACSQSPAQVVMKGHEYYGQGTHPPTQLASASSSRAVTAVPAAKPAPTVEVAMRDVPPVVEKQPSYGFNPSPSTVALREQAQMAQIQVKELEPITAAKAKPQPQTASAPSILPEPQARVVAESNSLDNPASTPLPTASSGFVWPVKGQVISQFGPKAGGEYNDGINIAAREGEPIVAAADGEVVYSGNELRGYGNMVIVRHPGNIMTAYAHASRILVNKGDRVRQGAAVALVGKSGGLDKAQVHFGIRKDKEPVNPMEYLGASQFAAR